jgi:hypothetical protein
MADDTSPRLWNLTDTHLLAHILNKITLSSHNLGSYEP